jgi:spore coat polysaccharide biosynthesis predicted glycosyltransferase SpsG
MHADLLVMDGYFFAPGHAAASRSSAGEMVLRFDDLGTDTGAADIVLNGNAGAEIRFANDHKSARRRLLGADYFLVRRDVAAASAAPESGRIVLTLGAAAAPSLLIEIARRISETSTIVSVDCVGPFDAASGAMLEVPHRVRCVGPDGLVEALSRAALVVCGAGVTALEAASLGVPSVLVTVADNQVPGACAIDAAGAGRYLGNLETVRGKIPLAVAELVRDAAQLATMSANACALVDGQGAARVADVIEDELRQRGPRPGD